MTTKVLTSAPPSMNTYLEFIDPRKQVTVFKEKDATKMPEGKDFNSNIKNDNKSPLSKKVYIQPVPSADRAGP